MVMKYITTVDTVWRIKRALVTSGSDHYLADVRVPDLFVEAAGAFCFFGYI